MSSLPARSLPFTRVDPEVRACYKPSEALLGRAVPSMAGRSSTSRETHVLGEEGELKMRRALALSMTVALAVFVAGIAVKKLATLIFCGVEFECDDILAIGEMDIHCERRRLA